MTPTPDGTQPVEQISPTGTAQPTELAQQTAVTTAQTATETSGTPDIASLQAELAREREAKQVAEAQRVEYETRFKQTQAAYTQARQQIGALTGTQTQPQEDPLAPHVASLVAEGYSEKDARAVAQLSYNMVQPVLRQQQQQMAALQASNQIGDIMRQTWGSRPDLFTDPQVATQVEQQLRYNAINGYPVDADAARYIALDVQDKLRAQGRQGATPVQQPVNYPPQFASFNGQQGGYQAAPAARAPQSTPEADALAAKMQEYLRIPSKTA